MGLRASSDLKSLDNLMGQVKSSETNVSIESSGSKQSYLLGNHARLPQLPSSPPSS